ncbi:MAG: ABC transporter permease [Proteobacteria bacterium]|jgi:ABC-2 type transport system permease protein|nr:ABC transporter permease [Pseudomonadota bacterium]
MIRTIFIVQWLQLKRDVVALIMTFVLPIVFFSVYALMLGGVDDSGVEESVQMLVVDQDGSEFSRSFVSGLAGMSGLAVIESTQSPTALEDRMVSEEIAVGLIIPEGFADAWHALKPRDRELRVIYDPANPYARYLVIGQVQSLALASLPELFRLHAKVSAGVPFSPEMQAFVDDINGVFCARQDCDQVIAAGGILEVTPRVLKGNNDGDVAYYAAGVGVMFLLFSMAGAGGSLLAEQEKGTLERLLNSRMTMSQYILGCWLFFACTGTAQLAVMFIWAGVVFTLPDVNLAFALTMTMMTVVTAMAAAAFGMVLASLCRSRAQLAGVSTIVILVMSALGGSMFPRFLMPPIMETIGLFTFNGWAIEGFTRIFWQANSSAGLGQQIALLLPNLAMLVAMTLGFLGVARYMVVRWEES